jgi:hypothetical protein
MKYIKEYKDYRDNNTLNFILNENVIGSESINEGIIDRIKEASKKGLLTKDVIKNLIKKGVLTTSLITALMTSDPSFAKAYNDIKGDSVEVVDNKAGDFIDVSKSFESGKFRLSEEGVSDLESQLSNLLKGKPENIQYKLTIIASESKVPNKDIETGKRMAPLELANKRASDVKQHIEEYLKKNKYNIGLKIDIQSKIGGSDWKSGEDVNQEKFKSNQFVRISMVEDEANPFCGFNFEAPEGTTSKNNIGFDKKFNVTNLYGSGYASIDTGSIPDRLIVYSDGKIIGDTGFIATSTNDRFSKYLNYTPRNILHLTKLYNEKNAAVQSTEFYKINVRHVKTFEELVLLMLKDKSKVGTNWKDRGLEEDVNLPLVELEAMFKNGQRDFVFYENKKSGVRYDLKGDVKEIRTLVYSVIGKTQFKININCK